MGMVFETPVKTWRGKFRNFSQGNLRAQQLVLFFNPTNVKNICASQIWIMFLQFFRVMIRKIVESTIMPHRIHVWYMYLIIYIYHKNQPNVGKYTIHGWYRYWKLAIFWVEIVCFVESALYPLKSKSAPAVQLYSAQAPGLSKLLGCFSRKLVCKWLLSGS